MISTGDSDWLIKGLFEISNLKVVLEASSNANSWESWGVRDPAPMSDELGGLLQVGGEIPVFYTGSDDCGLHQQSGVAVFKSDGEKLTLISRRRTLDTSKDSWDSMCATTPWVVRLKSDEYVMIYRGASEVGIAEGVGVARSVNGQDFVKQKNNPVLTPRDFLGMHSLKQLMGVFTCCKASDDYFVILFEGYDSRGLGQIFGAKTKDFVKFQVMNSGYPVFSSHNVQSWPTRQICNPRLLSLPSGDFLLGFNGAFRGDYSLGFALTKDFVNWVELPGNPYLIPRTWPITSPFSGRIEGPYIYSTPSSNNHPIRIFFMAIPAYARNHEHSVIAVANLVRKHDDHFSNWRWFPESHVSATSNQHGVALCSESHDPPSIAHFIRSESETFPCFEIILLRIHSAHSAVAISVSNSLVSLRDSRYPFIVLTADGLYIRTIGTSLLEGCKRVLLRLGFNGTQDDLVLATLANARYRLLGYQFHHFEKLSKENRKSFQAAMKISLCNRLPTVLRLDLGTRLSKRGRIFSVSTLNSGITVKATSQ